jgi:hypothetical protein
MENAVDGSVSSWNVIVILLFLMYVGDGLIGGGYVTRIVSRDMKQVFQTIRGWTMNSGFKNTYHPMKQCTLTSEHIDIIASRRWRELLAWIVFHPDELLLVDKRNQRVLHHACLFRAPAQIIEMLLYQKPELAHMANIDNEIPLHWAIRLSTPNEIIKLLLAVHPSSACCIHDKDGNTALSMVWERHESFLLDQWWNSGKNMVNNNSSWSGILFFFQCYSYCLKYAQRTISTSGSDTLHEIEDHKQLFRPLHTATQCPSCPLMLYTLLLRVYDDQIQEQDHNGRLPLAVACLDPVSNRSVGVITKVHLLLAEYTFAALVQDYDGRLPIFTALAACLTWEEGVDKLISLDSKSLLLYDNVTQLPAFLLAAADSKQSANSQQDKVEVNRTECERRNQVDHARLSTIFCILRSDPAQINVAFNIGII